MWQTTRTTSAGIRKDRKVVFVGEGQYEGTEECAPLFYVAVAETEEAMKEMVEEFIREVPTLLVDVGQAPRKRISHERTTDNG